MSKRRAAEAAPEMPSAKKHQSEDLDDSYVQDVEDDVDDVDYVEDDFTSAQTPNSATEVESVVTNQTGATTPRPKFPSDLKTLACTWPGCPKSFNRPARLRDHLNSHTNNRPHKCPYDGCDKDYIEDKHLKQHIKAVHTLERKHVCPREGCGKSFVTGTRLKRHQAVHEGEERFRCQDCGQSFRKKETLNKHVRKDHENLPAYACSVEGCTSAFDSKNALKRHHQREHGEVKYWCEECGLKQLPDGTEERVGFTTEVLLQAHVRQEHQNCLFCDFKSKARWELAEHVDVHHSGKTIDERRVFECPYEGCDKRFTKKNNLRVHTRTAHEGVRFECGEFDMSSANLPGWDNSQGCGEKLTSKLRLEEHIRYKHLGQERPKLTRPPRPAPDPVAVLSGAARQEKASIACQHCDETFIRYHDLYVHTADAHDPAKPPDTGPFDLPDQQPSLFAQDVSAWPDDDAQEEIFAAEMDYGPATDEWIEDEANILLLAREPIVDPALAQF